MDDHYENIDIGIAKEIEETNSLSCSGEYIEVANFHRKISTNEYATIDIVGQKHLNSTDTNEIQISAEKNLKNQTSIKKMRKEFCFLILAALFFSIFIILCFAFTAYNYNRLESLSLQLKTLDKRDSNQFKESSLRISDVLQAQFEIFQNMEQFNISFFTERNQVEYYFNKLILSTNTSNYVNRILDIIGLHESYPVSSCRYIPFFHPFKQSGYYWVKNQHGITIQVYCILEPSCIYYRGCNTGWTRIAKLSKVQNGAQCFPGLKNYPTNTSSCVTESDSATCSSTFISSFNIPYSRIHGRVRAYGVGTPDGFRSSSLTINDNYVDGISLTVGNTTNRQHITTLVPTNGSCTLRNKPTFVSYKCDRLQENRAQRGPDEKYFFCTYRLLGKQILSSPSFIAVALAIPAIYRLTVPFIRLI